MFQLNRIKQVCCILLVSLITTIANAQTGTEKFRDPSLPVEVRVKDLVGRLTVEEKISLLGFNSKAVPRLGIPAYNWWNEALHGVARAGKATVFPQAIGMAATFNDQLLNEVANAISTEARAKYNMATAKDRRLQYMGLTFWSPNINIFRDPRWGRGQETYGEDPYLTARMGVAFVKGMQGNDPTYLKTAACAKHFAVHSGPEEGRHSFNAIVDEKDLRETYLYAFKKLVDAGVESVMCAYNRVNNEPCCTSETLLKRILRNEWKFKGHVVTDCWALDDIWKFHKVMNDRVEVAAAAIKAGINLDCSDLLQADLMKAYERKLVTAAEIDSSLAGILRTQVRLGFYDDTKKNPFSLLGEKDVNSKEHIELARKAAQQSMVLLKNDNNLLPISTEKYGSIMVLGPNAGAMDPMVANYHGMTGNIVTFAEGITEAAGPGVAVQYDQGSDYTDTTRFGGLWAAGNSDITIAVIGLTPVLEGEEGDAFLAAKGGDKPDLDIPAPHMKLLKELRQKGKPVVVVVTAGSAIDIAKIEPYADAIIMAWYPGEQGGNALADLVFGKVSPSGRLPVTFYKSFNDLPAYEDYGLKGRTYRYFDGAVQYPFGYGLSYTNFNYENILHQSNIRSLKDSITISVNVSNAGNFTEADEVVQLYVQYPGYNRMPLVELKQFQRITVPKGQVKKVDFKLPVIELQKWDEKKQQWKLFPGEYKIFLGSNSRDIKQQVSLRLNDKIK